MKLTTKASKSHYVDFNDPKECFKMFAKDYNNNLCITIKNFKTLNSKMTLQHLTLGVAVCFLAYYIGKANEKITKLEEEHRIYNELHEETINRVNNLKADALK